MKKTQILNIVNLILLTLLIVSLIVLKLFFNSYFSKLWYICIIFIFAIRLYAKFWLFKSDNILWFAIVLTGIFLFMLAYNFLNFPLVQWPLLVQIPCFASGILFLIYRNHLHLYLDIMLNIIASPLFLISNNIGNIWLFLAVETVAVFIAIIVVRFINAKFRKE